MWTTITQDVVFVILKKWHHQHQRQWHSRNIEYQSRKQSKTIKIYKVAWKKYAKAEW